jgi:hypothetical protein
LLCHFVLIYAFLIFLGLYSKSLPKRDFAKMAIIRSRKGRKGA